MLTKKLSSLTSFFYKLSQNTEMQNSGQKGEYFEILNKSGLWGGSPFDLNGPVANIIFNILDKNDYHGKINANITVDTKLNVMITISPPNQNIQKSLQASFGPKMSMALKKFKASPPSENMTWQWLVDVGY